MVLTLPTFLCELPAGRSQPPGERGRLARQAASWPAAQAGLDARRATDPRDARGESGDAARHAGIRCVQASRGGISQARPAVLGNGAPQHENHPLGVPTAHAPRPVTAAPALPRAMAAKGALVGYPSRRSRCL